MNITAVIRGGGDLGTGVAFHLRRQGVRVIITELDNPKMVRHPVCLGYAVYNGVQKVEGLTARLMSLEEAKQSWERPSGSIWDDIIPVVIDCDDCALEVLRPAVVCDCRMLKYGVPDERGLAPVVVGLGPGFFASCRWQGGEPNSHAGEEPNCDVGDTPNCDAESNPSCDAGGKPNSNAGGKSNRDAESTPNCNTGGKPNSNAGSKQNCIAGNSQSDGLAGEQEGSALGVKDCGSANVDCVIETQRGGHLGDIITSGRAIPNTGVPGVIGGESSRRLLRAPQAGSFRGVHRVGDLIEAGTVVGYVGELPIISAIGGRLRGLVHDGLQVRLQEKIGDCDPRGAAVSAFRISDKSHTIGASVAALLQSLPAEVQTQLQRHEELAHPAFASVERRTGGKAVSLGHPTLSSLENAAVTTLSAGNATDMEAPSSVLGEDDADGAAPVYKEVISIASAIISELRDLGDVRKAQHQRQFFKTAPGEYGADDKFLGLPVPQVRTVSKRYGNAPREVIALLLQSEYHEVRLCALQMLVQQFRRRKDTDCSDLIALYLALSSRVNNWDLVDLSVGMLGEWLIKRERSLLFSLANSDCLWCRRMAMVATQPLIKRGELADALAVAALLLPEREDLLHKAVGWMLREVGKQDGAVLRQFLRSNYANMPRTALRYAIEKFPEEERRAWLKGPM